MTARRPHDFRVKHSRAALTVSGDHCPFSPGNEAMTPPEVAAYRHGGQASQSLSESGPGHSKRLYWRREIGKEEFEDKNAIHSGEPLLVRGSRSNGLECLPKLLRRLSEPRWRRQGYSYPYSSVHSNGLSRWVEKGAQP